MFASRKQLTVVGLLLRVPLKSQFTVPNTKTKHKHKQTHQTLESLSLSPRTPTNPKLSVVQSQQIQFLKRMSSNPTTTTSASGSSGGAGGAGTTSGGGGPCGACKFLRRKCVAGCIFAPYFGSEQGAAHFTAVHRVFGASNVSKLLHHIPVHKRLDAVVTICYEAQARLRDPVYGCVAHIIALQQQVINLQAELSYLQAHLAALELPTPPPPPLLTPPPLSIADLPSASSMPATFDLSLLFEPFVQPWWTIQHRQIDAPQFSATRNPADISSSAEGGGGGAGGGGGGSVDLQALTQELLRRHVSPPASCIEASPLPTHSK